MTNTAKKLRYEIKWIEETIKVKEAAGEDASSEKKLVKEYKKYLPGGSKHHLWNLKGKV